MKSDKENTGRLLADAAKTFNPVKLVTGLYFNIFINRKRAVISILYFAGFLYSIFLILMAAAKAVFPDVTGFFLTEERGLYFGFLADKTGARDLLGYWFIPVSIICVVLLYTLLVKSAKYIVTLDIMNRALTRSEILRYSAHILALFWAGFWAWFGFASGIVEELSLPGILVHTAVPGLVFFIPVLVSWKWENIGAVLLVLTGIAASVIYIFIFKNNQWLYVVLPTMALPPVLAGCVLTLVSNNAKYRNNKQS